MSTAAQSSGTSTIVRVTGSDGKTSLVGGADPRREGLVLGGEPLTNNIALVELIWSIKSAAFRFTAQE